MTRAQDQTAFDHAFIAISRLLGVPDSPGSDLPTDHPARTLGVALSSGDQKTRALALAKALGPIAIALERRRL